MKAKNVGGRPPRRDRLIREREHDPYKTRLKLADPTVCPQCDAVYRDGRWRWEAPPEEAHQELCQACHRINDAFPAGVVSLGGGFVQGHKTEILGLARNEEAREKAAHPLHRIMTIEDGPDAVVINTTDIHLPRRIGEALRDAHEGDLDYHYEKESYFLRVNWYREQ
jgi:hypothetical protein